MQVRHSWLKWIYFFLTVLGAFLIVSSVWYDLTHHLTRPADWRSERLNEVNGVFLIGIPWLIYWRHLKNGRRLPSYNQPIVWKISEEGFEIDDATSKTFIAWNGLIKIIVRQDGILLYPQKAMLYWVPLTAFASPAEFDAATRLIPANRIAKK